MFLRRSVTFGTLSENITHIIYPSETYFSAQPHLIPMHHDFSLWERIESSLNTISHTGCTSNYIEIAIVDVVLIDLNEIFTYVNVIMKKEFIVNKNSAMELYV